MRSLPTIALAVLATALPRLTPLAHAHATYNLAGYAAGIGGSTNGADGSPATGGSAVWLDAPGDYTGGLPVNWYCGLHNATQVRTLQTGIAPNPPSGSLLAQVTSYNAANDPDLPTDRVLAVGGLSWSDPSNGDQGWGHGLDYGIIHVTPLDTILAGGSVKMTLTLADDPTDGVAVRLAYALYGGWDTNPASVRHQTFTTSPSPINDPLGSTGLTLIDYGVATAAGQTLSKTYDVTAAYGGKYTLFVAALGGVAGQYQLTAGLFPSGQPTNEELATCNGNLNEAMTTIGTLTSDADVDGVPDSRDGCAGTAAATAVDDSGCSQDQFCGNVAVSTRAGRKQCKKADWKNDEPLMSGKQSDCEYDKSAQRCAPKP